MNETMNPTEPTPTAPAPEPDQAIGKAYETPPGARRLVRRRDDRMIAGVCSGLGDYLGMDANIVRLLVILLAVFGGGAGVALYVAGWLLIPEEDAPQSVGAQLLGNIRS
jgi:phage shock protein PspC (stress-responsive transcriptional regulator)